MKWTLTQVAALAFAAMPASAFAATETSEAALTATLQFQTMRSFDINLPNEKFVNVSNGLPFSMAPGGKLRCEVTDAGLSFDRDGDGEMDATVSAPDEEHPTRLLTFRMQNGAKYALRAQQKGTWSVAPAGAMVGRAFGERVAIIDQNSNGRFDDFGQDAIVIGRGNQASFLSEVVSIDGKLFNLALSESGQSADFTPFQGATGTLNMGTDFEAKAKLNSVVLTDATGKLSFEMSGAVASKEALNLPAGTYRIHSGEVVLGKSHATLGPGRSAAIEVPANGKASFTWGGPVKAEFTYQRQGDELQIAPEAIRYFGRAGEVYSNFMPLGSSPNFQVKDRSTGEVLVDMVFPGNC